MKLELSGRLAEAFGRVERDLAIINGVGYFTPEEWIQLDGILHKGNYLFTDGPTKSSPAFNSPAFGPGYNKSYHLETDVGDLLLLDDYEGSSSQNSGAVERLATPGSAESIRVEDKKQQSTSTSARHSMQPRSAERAESTAPMLPEWRKTKTGNETIQQMGTTTAITHTSSIHPTLSLCAPLSRRFYDGEQVDIKMEARQANNNQHKSSKKAEILQMNRGDMIHLHKFEYPHRFWATNMKTGKSGRLHEQIFFSPPWAQVVDILDTERAKQLGQLECGIGKQPLHPGVALRSNQHISSADSHEADAAKEWEEESTCSAALDTPSRNSNSMKGLEMDDRKVHNPESNTLFIRNVDFAIDENKIRDAFRAHGVIGDIIGVNLASDIGTGKRRGFGYVNFRSVEDAKAAFEVMTGAEIAGRTLLLDYFVPRDKRESSQFSQASPGTFPKKLQEEKSLTCWFWKTRGECSLPEHECKHSHCDTGALANHPNGKNPNGPNRWKPGRPASAAQDNKTDHSDIVW